VSQDTAFTAQPHDGYPNTIYDSNSASNPSETYGQITGRSDPRLFRVAMRVSF
jgi:hypothetical protein